MVARRDRLAAGLALLLAAAVTGVAGSPPAAASAAPAAPSAPGLATAAPPDSAALDPEAVAKIRELNARILTEPRNADLYNDLGVVYAEAGQWVPARDAFIAAVQANPINASFHRNLAQVLMQMGETDMAVAEFKAYEARDLGGGADASRLIGEAYRKAEMPAEAVAAFQEGLRKVADRAEKLRLALSLARLQQEQGQDQQAREALASQVDLARAVLRESRGKQGGASEGGEMTQSTADSLLAAGEDPQAAAGLGRAVMDRLLTLYVEDARLLAESGMAAESAAMYRQGWELEPERADLLLPLTVSQQLLAGQVDEARALAARATERQPQGKGAWLAAGLVAEHENRLAEAIAAYQKAKQIDPEDREIDLKLGSVHIKNGDMAAAERYLARGLQSEKATPEFVYNYGVSLLREKKYDQAADAFRRVVDRAPGMGAAWQALATTLRQAEKYAEAVPAYRRAIELGPDAKLHFNLAFCLSRSDDLAGAIEQYRQAIALEPGFQEAHYNLARALIQAERHEEALAALDAFAKVEPKSYRVFFTQGLALYHLGRYQEAIEKFDLALEQKETADVLNNIGLAYDKLGDKKEAQSYYKAARDVGGGK